MGAYEFFSIFSYCASQSETTFYETKISPKALHQSCKIVTHIVILFSLHIQHVCFEILINHLLSYGAPSMSKDVCLETFSLRLLAPITVDDTGIWLR